MDPMSMSTSASSVRTLHHSLSELAAQRDQQQQLPPPGLSSATGPGDHCNINTASSTHSLVLPSPPDSPNLSPVHSALHSPSLDSVSESSLPSVSSSFFFSSSAAGSPGRASRPESYPASYPHSEHGSHSHLDRTLGGHNLVIPSLALPTALRRPTPFGQTLGEIRLLVLGAQGAGKSFLTGLLLEDNEDVVDVGTWEDWGEGDVGGYGKVLCASTDWIEQKDTFGLERYEPSRNVHIVELPGYAHDADGQELITRLKNIIEKPFRDLQNIFHPETQPSSMVAGLLASPMSPLYTAMVFLLPSPPTPLDTEIIAALSSHVPLIVLPRAQNSHATGPVPKLSTFRPASAVGLRNGLFHSPETIALLRSEAADRYLRWREVEKSVDQIMKLSLSAMGSGLRKRRLGDSEWGKIGFEVGKAIAASDSEEHPGTAKGWNKANWEAEWMHSHSQDVDLVRREREGTITARTVADLETPGNQPKRPTWKFPSESSESGRQVGLGLEEKDFDEREIGITQSLLVDAASRLEETTPKTRDRYTRNQPLPLPGRVPVAFDPLHLPSLIMFSVALLGPLKARMGDSMKSLADSLSDPKVQAALVGGFCAGVGIGFFSR